MNFTNNISFASLAKWHVQLIDWKQENIPYDIYAKLILWRPSNFD